MLYGVLVELISEWEFNQPDTLKCFEFENILVVHLQVRLNSDEQVSSILLNYRNQVCWCFVSHKEQTLQNHTIMLTMVE